MSLFFILPWFALLYISSKSRSHLLFFFVLCQFAFVGLGLSLFPYLGKEYLNTTFSTFNLSSIDERDFAIASSLLLVCSFIVVVFSSLLMCASIKKRNSSKNYFKQIAKKHSLSGLTEKEWRLLGQAGYFSLKQENYDPKNIVPENI